MKENNNSDMNLNSISCDGTSQNRKRVGRGIGSGTCLLYTSPSPRDKRQSRMPSSA